MRWRPAQRRDWTPIWLGLVVVALVGAYVWRAVATQIVTFATLVTAAYALTFAITGAIVWLRRPEYLTGRLMVAAGFLTLVNPLQRFPDVGALYAIGTHLNGMQEAVLAYLLLTYPSGHAARGFVGWMARSLLVIAPVLGVADLLTRPNDTPVCAAPNICSDQPNPFVVIDLGTSVAEFSAAVIGVMAVLVLAVVAWRIVDARGAARRALAPILIAGAIGAAGVAIREAFKDDLLVANAARTLQLLIPVALGIGFLRSRMARAGVAELVLRAGPAPTFDDLEAAIRRTLHDPSVRLLRWVATGKTYTDADGGPAGTTVGVGRHVTLISGPGGPLAAIEHDPVLAEEGDLLPSVVAAVRIVLENERLATSVQAQAADAARLPAGVVTFISTDVEGSTELLDRLRERYAELVSELRHLLRRAIREAGGTEIDSRADEFFAAIPSAAEAIRAAVSVQGQLEAHPWPDGARVLVRIGLHTGEPQRTPEGYIGMDVHLAARVGAAGHGGQILVSETTREAVHEGDADVSYHDLGRYALKGIPRPVRLYQVIAAGRQTSFAPLRAEPVSA